MDLKKGSLTSGIFVGMGSNLGDRPANLQQALQLLQQEGIILSGCSPLYETPSWGKENEPAYLNAVVQLQTSLSPEALLELLLKTENKLGRDRPYRWAPRTLDLDLLYFHQEIRNTDQLTLPHPRIEERKFVLQPLCDLSPGFLHPVSLKNQESLLQECPDTSSITRWPAVLNTH